MKKWRLDYDPNQKPDWGKGEGLLPAIIQDADDNDILMLGYMNQESLQKPKRLERLHFLVDPKIDYGLKVRHQETYCILYPSE